MLIVFAILMEQSNNFDHSPDDRRLFHAMASFCFLIFVSFGLFGGFLAIFRDEVLIRPVSDEYSLFDETGEAQRMTFPVQTMPRKPPLLHVHSRSNMDENDSFDPL